MQRNAIIPLIVACSLFMENMASTVIAPSLRIIQGDIGESLVELKLGLTSYLVGLAVFIPISGWARARLGSRTVFASAIVVFVAGSLLCAVSSTLVAFVAARFLQGIGGAMMVPVGRLVLLRAVPKDELLVALNYLTIPALLGPVTGPALGGAITLYFSWRWIFLINLPIGVLGLYLVLRHIPNVKEPETPPLDLAGFALTGVGLSVLMLGLSSLGGHLLPGKITAACIVLGALALAPAGTPSLVIFLVLLASGCLRSLQFTALQAVSFAEVTRETMSQASSIASMAQRLAQSLGVAFGAYALQISSLAQGHADIVTADFAPAFGAVALLSAASLFFHAALPPGAAAGVSGPGRGKRPPGRRL